MNDVDRAIELINEWSNTAFNQWYFAWPGQWMEFAEDDSADSGEETDQAIAMITAYVAGRLDIEYEDARVKMSDALGG